MSNLTLFFDTETTGLWHRGKALTDPAQPYPVALAALLFDESGTEVASLNTLVKTDGWDIPQVVVNIHGINKARADAEGQPLIAVLMQFDELLAQCKLLVAHNIEFDLTILAIAYARLARPHTFLDKGQFCTMNEATDICKIPKKHGAGFKWPKLTEVHQHFFGAPLADGHNAMNDVRATAAVYYKIINAFKQ